MNYLFTLLNNARHWFNAKVSEQPLTRQDAYIVTITGCKVPYKKLYGNYLKEMYESIHYTARNGYTEYLLRFPKWMNADTKNTIMDTLKQQEYSILYEDKSAQFILISWNNG